MDPNSRSASDALFLEAGKLGWFHSIPLPSGSYTRGHKTAEQLKNEEQLWQFPADLSNRTVLDIGCADGYWAVLALQRGAKEVVAIDEQITGGLRFLLDHNVYPIDFRQMDLFSADFLELPAFDFVIFAGVLYHARNPIEALMRLRRVTKGFALVETLLDNRFGEDATYAVYYEHGECNNDPTNWWGPSSRCIEAMLRTGGFSRIERTSFYHGQPPFDRGSYLAYAS
jgi:tRNA (mo5U34)-methyltransferase